jgi:hypothetical protein
MDDIHENRLGLHASISTDIFIHVVIAAGSMRDGQTQRRGRERETGWDPFSAGDRLIKYLVQGSIGDGRIGVLG